MTGARSKTPAVGGDDPGLAAAAWYRDLRGRLPRTVPVETLRVGDGYTAVSLARGQVGIAYRPDDADGPGPDADRRDAWGLAERAVAGTPAERSAGIAALNALTAAARGRADSPVRCRVRPTGALDAVEPGPDTEVAMVGAFLPLIERLDGRVAAIRVIERRPARLAAAGEADRWCPPGEATDALAGSDLAVISGSALVVGGMRRLVRAAGGTVVVAGPTAPLWPATFFALGVDVLAGARVREPEATLRAVGAADRSVKSTVEKVCLVDPSSGGRPGP